ncbi:MAG: peptide ABC transporter substrate-binding protein [Ruminococcaceae bacterium]|nr:peptide ABC transporter substrate-binding protein [Oscillospiraceae bacterium]
MLFTMSGCGEDDGCDYTFRYDISSNPVTLDPQIANDVSSDIVIENVFTGLLTLDKDGSVKEGAASEYTVSDDGLTYNFKLRDDIYWTDNNEFEEKCTAKDFVYGFTRLFLPETRAPRAKDYFCIKNSELLNKGKTDSSQLGVKAKGEYELEITLDYPNPRFLTMLTEPPAMPCSEKFFIQSQGKYGLSDECTPSNGSFYVRKWLYDPYTEDKDSNSITLVRNSKNAEGVCPAAVTFYIRDKEVFIDDFLGNDVHCVSVSESEKALIKGDFINEEFGCITCGMVFNRKSALFSNSDFCMALALLTDREMLSSVPEFKAAEGIVPDEVSMSGKSYRELAGACRLPEYDVTSARKYFLKAQPKLDTSLFTGAKVIVPDSAAETAVSYVMQEWQREFGFYCVIERLDGGEFDARLKSGDYDIAVTELSGKYNSPSAYLEQFVSDSPDNFARFSDSGFEAALKQAELSGSAEQYLAAEQELIDKAAFIPLYRKNEYFFTVKGGTDIVYDPFSKTVDFTLAKIFD